jgi:hypothetical protein
MASLATLLDQMAQTTEAAIAMASRALTRPRVRAAAPSDTSSASARPSSRRPSPRVRPQVPAATRLFLVGPGELGAAGEVAQDRISSMARAAAEASGWSVEYASALGHLGASEVTRLRAAAVLVVVLEANDAASAWIGVAIGARKPVVLLTPEHLPAGLAHAGVQSYPQGRVLTFRSHEDCRRQLLGILRRVKPVARP